MGDYGWKTYALLYTNSAFTLISWILVCIREKKILELHKLEGLLDKADTLITSKRYKSIVVEWVFLSIHPYTFFIGQKNYLFNREVYANIYYHYNDYLNLMSILKNTYILNLMLHNSVWKSSRARRIW